MKKRLIFISIIILQLIFLAGMISFHKARIEAATKIVLETVPVDPFSIFRGRYIRLNYKISNLSPEIFKDCKPGALKRNDDVYLVLEKKDAFWEPVAAYKNRPEDTNLIYLKGKLDYYYSKNARVRYGIESYFLSEKSADEVEKRRRDFRRGNWMDELNEEDRRIHNSVGEWWYEKLDNEINYWTKEGIIEEKQAARIREKYKGAFERIQTAQSDVGRLSSLTVEIAVTKDGTGYPTKLFLEGKEYR